MLSTQPPTTSPLASSQQAMLHLLLHCCHVDGECNEAEVKAVFSIMYTLYPVDESWLAENTALYHRYANCAGQNLSYLRFLLCRINAPDPERLLWYCAQVTVCDGEVSFAEELLFERLAVLLQLPPETLKAVHRLAWQQRLLNGGQP